MSDNAPWVNSDANLKRFPEATGSLARLLLFAQWNTFPKIRLQDGWVVVREEDATESGFWAAIDEQEWREMEGAE